LSVEADWRGTLTIYLPFVRELLANDLARLDSAISVAAQDIIDFVQPPRRVYPRRVKLMLTHCVVLRHLQLRVNRGDLAACVPCVPDGL